MSSRAFGLGRVAVLALVIGACAGSTADVQLDAANQAVQSAAARRAKACAPEVWRAAEAALAEARRLAAAGDVEGARSKAGQAEALARQAEAASPPGCGDEQTEPSGEDGAAAAGTAGAGVTDAASTMAELQAALETIYFDYNRAVIREDSKAVLTALAEILRRQPNASIEIEGHCDVRGSTEYNLHLGERRARSVMKYLVTQGVDPEQLRIISYGEERPADFGFSDSAHAANRRAELRRL